MDIGGGGGRQDEEDKTNPGDNYVFSPHVLSTYSALSSKESTCNAGDVGLIPGLGRFPEEGNGNPLQYSCLENIMDRAAWWAAIHGVSKSRERLSD